MLTPIIVPNHSLPYANEVPTDGQFVDEEGNAIPYVDPDGPVTTTTTDHIVAGKTSKVTVASAGIQVGDWIVLTNGAQTSEPKEVILAGSNYVVVDTPFDISATGTSTLTVSKITPKLSWIVPLGEDFGNLAWNPVKHVLSADVNVHSSVSGFKDAFITIQIGDASTGVGMAQKTQKLVAKTGLPCKRYLEPFQYQFAVSLTGPPGSLAGKSVALIAFAHFIYRKQCNIRGMTVSLGHRASPIFNIPS